MRYNSFEIFHLVTKELARIMLDTFTRGWAKLILRDKSVDSCRVVKTLHKIAVVSERLSD